MKSVLNLLAILVFILSLPRLGFTQNKYPQEAEPKRQEQKDLNAKADQIEIIEGIPNRPFKRLEPVWVASHSMSRNMKQIKRKAAKLGADAIIEFRIDTKQSALVFQGWGGSSPMPVIQGWAVKWLSD